jgi:hypothetical protein
MHIGGLEIVFEPHSRKWEWEIWGGLEGVPVSIRMREDAAHVAEKFHCEMAVFGARYWNVSCGSSKLEPRPKRGRFLVESS